MGFRESAGAVARGVLKRLLMRVLGFVIAVVIGLGYLWYKRSQLELGARMKELSSDPRFGTRRQQAGEDDGLRFVSELSRRGMHRLDDSTLVRNAALMARILNATDIEQCSQLARAPRLDDVLSDVNALRAIDSVTTQQWIDLTFLAAHRELEERPTKYVRDAQATEAMSALLERLPASQRDRLVRTLSDPAGATAVDACWAGRTLYGGVAKLAEPQRSWLARAALPDA